MAKIRRNERCPCGSGKKYKKCHGNLLDEQPSIRRLRDEEIPPEVKLAFERHKAQESIRQQQQGLGNPIVSFRSNGYQMVAVGDTLYWSKDWQTFHDFLFYYIKKVVGEDWGNMEIAKPYEQRHPILQWHDQLCRYQNEIIRAVGKIKSAPMIGAVQAYMDLAYNLYLLGHNTVRNKFSEKLQNRLKNRLKNMDEFPGAYYESYVGAGLIKSGYEVEFGDEVSGVSSCDYIVTNKSSKRKYAVEAKAIKRLGALGATRNASVSNNLERSIKNQLKDALAKPSALPRIIFVEVNLPENITEMEMGWIDEAVRAVRIAENLVIKGKPADSAYVILTNHPHHYHQTDENFGRAAVAVGFKIPDFGYGSEFGSLREMYYAKQKHIDVTNLMDSLKTHYNIPVTFDGKMPSEAFHENPQRLIIGETYHFEDMGEGGLIAKVTTATVDEIKKIIYIGTDKGRILTRPISDDELADYKRHPDAFFGAIHPQSKNIDDPFELFEWMLNSYSKTSKEKLIEFMKNHPDMENLRTMSQKELALIYCERVVQSILLRREGSEQAKGIEPTTYSPRVT